MASSFCIHDDQQAAVETKGLVVGLGVNLVGHGGKRDVKAAKVDEAARKGGVLKPDREETKDSWLDEVCVDLLAHSMDVYELYC